MTESVPAAVVLAGGDGGRLGTPKSKLAIGAETYLERIVHNLREAGVHRVSVVMPAPLAEWGASVVPGTIVVPVADPNAPMIASLRAGTEALAGEGSVVVALVDHPFVAAGTYRLLAETANANPGCVIKPVYSGRSGHPIVIPPAVVQQVLVPGETSSLRDLIRQSGVRQCIVAVDDGGVVWNINTRDDLHSMEQL